MSEHSNLFYLKIEQTNAQQFENQTGYNLWHRRMGHSTNHAIRASIKHTIGMESWIGVNYGVHVKYLFGHEPGGRPAWTSTRDPVSVSTGGPSQAPGRDPDAGD